MKRIKAHIVNSRQWSAITMIIIALCNFAASAQLLINGNKAISDTRSNIILYTIPKQQFGHDFTAVVQADTTCGWHNITVNGRSLKQNPITFDNVTGDKVFIVRAIANGKPIVKRLMFTYLPIMLLDGDFGYEYINASASLITPDGIVDNDMMAMIKWRGGYTNSEDRHKRNYNIKFIDENGNKKNRRLLGMRKDNHWKLDAAQVDLSRVRNRVATDLWLDMATEPYYYQQAPDVLTGARGKMIELFVNNEYKGIYNLCECIDRKQLQVMPYDEDNNEFHGMMWEVTKWTQVTAFKKTATYHNDLPAFDNFEIAYPDFEDVTPTNHEDIHDAVWFVATSSTNQFNNNADKYFDMPVIIDYAIFNQFLTAIDNEVNNIFWVIYDRQQSKKLTLAVWDLDWSAGTNRNSPDFRGGRANPDYDYEFSNKLLFRLQEPSCIYNKAMIDRYWQLRKTWLSTKNLTERYSNAIDNLILCGAAAREQERWSGDSDINGLTLDLNQEKEFIVNWIKERMAFLDRTMMRHPCDVNADGAVNASDISIINQIIMEGTIEPSGIYDINHDGAINVVDLLLVKKEILGD